MRASASSSEESSPCSEVIFDESIEMREETPPPDHSDAAQHYHDNGKLVCKPISIISY